ncbi:hypothetical protein [Natronoarchaeum rubrum]|uniref:hypothetical protein n=1 Tax=Natronoarchaeum rubrum TaxID=755311 RepID=UPI0021126CC7|nr:hypothetical protein [Natronoarchaeum rubrum]HMB51567.1 hypothetical protein [Natronoarchaeum rubrum]
MGDAERDSSRSGAGQSSADPSRSGASAESGGDDGAGSAVSVSPPTRDDASGYGLGLTIVGAVLLALGYYGVLAVRESGEFGRAVPEPFYFLAIAVLFVLELLNSRRLGAVALARALAFAAVYGTLVVFAVEGGAALWAAPEIALEGYGGVTVLAGALVVSALAYVGYLTVVDRDG